MTVVTHGCRSNIAEQDTLERLAPVDSIVINSCAVTAKAVHDARAAAKRAIRSGRKVFVTGCAAVVASDRFSNLGVTIVPNRDKLDPAVWGKPGTRSVASTRMSRGFLAIQDGCDHHCTFCVTRIARGASRSTPADAIVRRARTLVAQGAREIVLTGIDATSYGLDLEEKTTLGALVLRLLAEVEELGRLRMSSLDAAEIEPDLLAAFRDPRVMPHVHLSLQSGDNLVLKRMRRRHSREMAIDVVRKLKDARPDIAIGADFIAGFPTENEAAHQRSRALLEECDVVHAHVFPYSPRPGTAAARMPQADPATRKQRARELREAASAQKIRFLRKFIGKDVTVVSEGGIGLDAHGNRVRLVKKRPRGDLVTVKVRTLTNGELCE